MDTGIFLALNFDGGPFWDAFFGTVTGKLIWIPLYVFILWLIYRRYGFRDMLIALACLGLMVGVADQTANFFKDYVPKLRPSHTPQLAGAVHTINNYLGGATGTVSAHAAISFGITAFSSLLLRNRIFTCSMILWALLVSYSRIYAGLHFPLDILFGIVIGILTGWLTALLWGFIVKKLSRLGGAEGGRSV